MKLLVTAKLADRSLGNHIYPLCLLAGIDEILIVRDTKGPVFSKEQPNLCHRFKVKYYCPPSQILRFPILAFLFKFILMIYLSMKEKPILIHSYLLFPHGFLAFIVGKITRKNVGVSLLAGPVELYVFGGSPIDKYAYTKPLPKLTIKSRIILEIIKRFDVITTTGSYTKKFLVDSGICSDNIYILHHVVDENFKSIDVKRDYDVSFIGRLVKVKHVENLIRAIERVREEWPDIKLLIVGDGPEEGNLKNLTRRLRLDNNVHFLGYKSDPWNWFSRSKLAALTSEREGFPYSAVEALSCGTPVIAFNCGDICDIVKSGYNGILLNDYRNIEALSNTIMKLLRNPDALSVYSINASRTANKLTNKSVASVWEDIIYSILHCHKRCSAKNKYKRSISKKN